MAETVGKTGFGFKLQINSYFRHLELVLPAALSLSDKSWTQVWPKKLCPSEKKRKRVQRKGQRRGFGCRSDVRERRVHETLSLLTPSTSGAEQDTGEK